MCSIQGCIAKTGFCAFRNWKIPYDDRNYYIRQFCDTLKLTEFENIRIIAYTLITMITRLVYGTLNTPMVYSRVEILTKVSVITTNW